jgi:hypothetical protein
VPEQEEQQGFVGSGREENKSQLEGVWVSFFLFVFFSFSLSRKRTTGLCLQQRGIFHLLLSDWALIVYVLIS